MGTNANDSPALREICPSRRAIEVLADKWALLIIPVLRNGPARNNELLRRIDGISQKMLTQTLKSLQAHGLITRTDYLENPPHVEYALSPLGRSLSDALLPLDTWVQQHHAELKATDEK